MHDLEMTRRSVSKWSVFGRRPPGVDKAFITVFPVIGYCGGVSEINAGSWHVLSTAMLRDALKGDGT
jgi:hypothetical protein